MGNKTMAKIAEITYEEIENMVDGLILEIEKQDWRPDLIIGLTRGGLLPAIRLSHKMEIPMVSLQWSTRENEEYRVSDCTLAEDAVAGKNLLIVDDLTDSGETFRTLMKDWETAVVDDINWHDNVRFGTLLYKEGSNFPTDYVASHVADESIWWEFPWEKK